MGVRETGREDDVVFVIGCWWVFRLGLAEGPVVSRGTEFEEGLRVGV